MKSGLERHRRPDLLLIVHCEKAAGAIRLAHALWQADGRGGWIEESFGELSITAEDPLGLVEELLGNIADLYGKPAQVSGRASGRLAGIGAALAAELLPEGLRLRLADLAGPAEPDRDTAAPTLYLLSEESWMPWELAALPAATGGGVRHLSEAFALTRWLLPPGPAPHLPLASIALVVPRDPQRTASSVELEILNELGIPDQRAVLPVEARYRQVIDALASGRFDGLHFSGHGLARKKNPELWGIQLEDGDLTPLDLESGASGLGDARPLVFLNACHSARTDRALTRLSGLSEAFLRAGAGAFVGTHWAVADQGPVLFAEHFYRRFVIEGLPLGEAARRARLDLRAERPDDPTRLAYAVFGHPLAVCADKPSRSVAYHPGVPTGEARHFFTLPQRRWHPEDSPGALLRADYGVVPFHRREQELADLEGWSHQEAPLKVRLYTGPGGMGKTRLAFELCRRLRDQGWRVGFVPNGLEAPPGEISEAILAQEGRLLAVFDYAEERRELLVPFFVRALARRRGPTRILLLARAALDWWDGLKQEGEGVGDLLAGTRTARIPLSPLAFEIEQRERSYRIAGDAFATALGRQPPGEPTEDPAAEHYERVLLLHMSALVAIEGVEAKGELGVLDAILNRERRFWRQRVEQYGLPQALARAAGRAMALLTLGGGVANEREAVETFRSLAIFGGQPEANLVAVAHLLRSCYPGETRWIEPIQPDLLGEHLIQRELESESDEPDPELIRRVFGPRDDERTAGDALGSKAKALGSDSSTIGTAGS